MDEAARDISVTGFSFKDNWCGTTTARGATTFHDGKKLIITFKVTPEDGFLGGNDVQTNGEASGVYDKDGKCVQAFERPTVNVPIGDVTVNAADKNVYLLSGLTREELLGNPEVAVGGVLLDLTQEGYGLEPWQYEYVNLNVQILDAAGSPVGDLSALREDMTYTVQVSVSPKTDGSGSAGTPATEKNGSDTGAINVFKPELTFKDSEAYYGADAPELGGNLTNTEWKHGSTADTAVTMTGTKPALDITCTPEADKISDGKINTKQDIGVDAGVKIGGTDVTDETTFLHTPCTGQDCTLPEGREFLLHVKTCTLTISKSGGAADESYVFDVYRDGAKYSEVTIWGNGSETLCELPVGTYTIAENEGWSWRYSADNGGEAVLSAETPDGTITCTNTKGNDFWQNGFSTIVRNIFDANR